MTASPDTPDLLSAVEGARNLVEAWRQTDAYVNKAAWSQPHLIVVANYGEPALALLPLLASGWVAEHERAERLAEENAALVVERDAAVKRGQMVLETKNEWADKARALEQQVATLTTQLAESDVPADPWKAFAWFINKCASGFGTELMRDGKTATEARNAVIGCFLQMAAGEACRVARSEEREPDPAKWRAATDDAFERAVKYTLTRHRAKSQEGEGE